MAATKRVSTATLIRGEVYHLRHPKHTIADPKEALVFKYGLPVVIEDRDIADMLEEIYDETRDGEGEVYEKPVFRVERNVAEPESDTKPRSKRLSADRPIRRRRPGK
jgi:hypothetical protein